ncbi:hypothetical protein Y032_0016g3166 [Ancylostoma ceylanicum]|uniref:Uncharacterized protein n=1 Tax=Ancylostoma ceylanicum TaxID=53326 RepID=A0A016V8Y9_9BILA|nr:hypothetical protein Y032_0016g3166 [Ancylostoma ceylanicum]
MHSIRKYKEIMKLSIVFIHLNVLCLARDSNQPTSSILLKLNDFEHIALSTRPSMLISNILSTRSFWCVIMAW